MTTRNLNRTWRDIVFAQYATDYEADVPFPIRYLIYTPQWKQDIFINVPNKIEVKTFRRSILTFFRAFHTSSDPTYQDEHISIRPRNPRSGEQLGPSHDPSEEDTGNDESNPTVVPSKRR